MEGIENASNGISQEQIRLDASGGAPRASLDGGRFAARCSERARHPIRDGTHPPQVDFPENRNVPAGGAGYRGRSRHERAALIKRFVRVFKPGPTWLTTKSVSSGEIEPAAPRRHGSAQETRGLRAHAPIGGCELELVGADELQLLAGAAHSRTGGVGAPFFSPQG